MRWSSKAALKAVVTLSVKGKLKDNEKRTLVAPAGSSFKLVA